MGWQKKGVGHEVFLTEKGGAHLKILVQKGGVQLFIIVEKNLTCKYVTIIATTARWAQKTAYSATYK